MIDPMRAEHDVPPPTARFFVVRGEYGCWFVSTGMAMAIERDLAAWPPRRWISFVDLHGSRIRVRPKAIVVVEQSTAAQRDAARWFHQQLCDEQE